MSYKNPSPLNEVIQNWRKICLDDSDNPMVDTEQLKADSQTFFRYISSNTEVVTDSKVVLQTKSSHEEALSQLIRYLDVVFLDDSHKCRLRALNLLQGAIDGCKDAGLSNAMVTLMGKFLVSHCGPINDEDSLEDFDTIIRDAAIRAISSLVGLPSPHKTEEELILSITERLDIATLGVSLRCATKDEIEGHFEDLRETHRSVGITEGLSTMPRSRRSMCFDALEYAIGAVTKVSGIMIFPLDDLHTTTIQNSLANFARFVSTCLHGESDPRCLLQLLRMIHAFMATFHVFFEKTGKETSFPLEDIFDAVAPYFPIQFTPPPNDTYGIKREDLHDALLSVITFLGFDDIAEREGQTSMVRLSINLFLENLQEREDSPGPLDKVETLNCLSTLLIEGAETKTFSYVTKREMKEISETLMEIHESASLSSKGGGQLACENRKLADTTRVFVSKLAFVLESCGSHGLLEEFAFLSPGRLSSAISKSPSATRSSIAYIACLASCGGAQTLRNSLRLGLNPLLDMLSDRMDDTEDTTVALHGIGALCSSCLTAVRSAGDRGVVWFPHPLVEYGRNILTLLMRPLEGTTPASSVTVTTAAVAALESFVYACGENGVPRGDVGRLCGAIKTMFDFLSVENGNVPLQRIYVRVLGGFLGSALGNSELRPWLLDQSPIYNFLTDTMYQALLSLDHVGATKQQKKLEVLTEASKSSEAVADIVVKSCIDLFCTSIENQGIENSLSAARGLACVLKGGGNFARLAYHRKEMKASRILDSIDMFGNQLNNRIKLDESVAGNISALREIAQSLLPAYTLAISPESVADVFDRVSSHLQLKSQFDRFALEIYLPLLASALNSQRELHDDEHLRQTQALSGLMPSILKSLGDLLRLFRGRSSLGQTVGLVLYSLLCILEDSEYCPVAMAFEAIAREESVAAMKQSEIWQQLRTVSLFGSAAASRSGVSSRTAENLAQFLLNIAWNGKAETPLVMNLSHLEAKHRRTCQIGAMREFGAILSSFAGNSLTKQKLIHVGLSYIRRNIDPGNTPPCCNLSYAASIIVCSGDIMPLGQENILLLFALTITGLSEPVPKLNIDEDSALTVEVRKVVLSSVLKILHLKEKPVLREHPVAFFGSESQQGSFVPSVTKGLLKIYAVSDPQAEVFMKLLALQGLEAIARVRSEQGSLDVLKPVVLALLTAAISHQSGLLRQAAVNVRNSWNILIASP